MSVMSDFPEVYLNASEIAARVAELGGEITADYAGKPMTVIAVSNGATVFAADLLRVIALPLQFDSLMIGSYTCQSQDQMVIRSEFKLDICGRHVLIVDEILDTGRTLTRVRELLAKRRPASIRSCVLLDKPSRRQIECRADYVGFEIPDKFVIGYGLDHDEYYRNLPYIGILS